MRNFATTLPLALFGAGGSLLLFACAVPSCGSDASQPSDAGIGDASRDVGHRDASRDAAVGDSGSAPSACGRHPRWQAVTAFTTNCAAQVAPTALLGEIASSLRPCNNGQAKCMELALPNEAGTLRPKFFAYPVGPEASNFLLTYASDPDAANCSRTLLVAAAGDFAVAGAIEMENTYCATVNAAADDLLLTRSKSDTPPRSAALGLGAWSSGAFPVEIPTTGQFPAALQSGNFAYAFVPSQGVYDIIDIPSKTLTKTVSPPPTIRQFYPSFAVAGDLWGTAVYGQLGKGEAWRLDGTGTWSPMIQKAGVHIFAPRSDGQTLFWVEGSGNETDLYPQPKLEIWAAPLTKSPATLNATKRKLVDISAYGYALEGAAHGGFFGINLGVSDLIVVRGSDGASQRIHLEGGWGAPSVAYLDATQVWFGHGASPASGTSFARIALDPWP